MQVAEAAPLAKAAPKALLADIAYSIDDFLKTIHKLELTIRELRKQIQLKEDEETIRQEVAFGRTMIEEGNPDMEEDNDI